MNKILIMACVCAGLIVAVAIGPANAATKCVPLTSTTTCKTSMADGQLDWSGSCITDAITVGIMGLAGCSSKNGGSVGAKSDTIITSSTLNDNKYCWCKMTNPAVSSWVFSGSNHVEAGMCAAYCARYCMTQIMNSAAFWSAMLSTLSD